MGSLYVCEFSNGTIKVGRSIDPVSRIASHVDRVACVGVELLRSQVYFCADSDVYSETELIRECASLAESIRGNEWFVGLEFETVCSWAERCAGLTAPVESEKAVIGLEALQLAVELCGSQSAFAKRMGVNFQVVWNWLNRDKRAPIEVCPFIEDAIKDPRVVCETLRPEYKGWSILRRPRIAV